MEDRPQRDSAPPDSQTASQAGGGIWSKVRRKPGRLLLLLAVAVIAVVGLPLGLLYVFSNARQTDRAASLTAALAELDGGNYAEARRLTQEHGALLLKKK